MAPTVSVVMATCEGARHAPLQLASLYAQTVAPLEILVADDASTDGTPDLLAGLAARHATPTRLLRRPTRLGFRENFLRAALEARGDLIAFCDQDDVWRPDKIAACLRHAGDPGVSLIAHAARLIDEQGRVIGRFRQGMAGTRRRPPLGRDLWGTYWGFSIVFRRELLRLWDAGDRPLDYADPAHPLAHDRWISFLGQLVGATVEIDAPLVDYRQHAGGLFGAPARRAWPDLRARSRAHLAATEAMLRVARGLPPGTAADFPLYDRAAGLAWLARGLEQLRARDRIYAAPDRARAAGALARALATGRYRNAHDGAVRWASLARDAGFVALGR